jgi:hypothetical protein
VVTPLVAIVAVTVVEFVLGVGVGYALGRRDNDRRGGHVDLTRAAARGDLGRLERS